MADAGGRGGGDRKDKRTDSIQEKGRVQGLQPLGGKAIMVIWDGSMWWG